MRSRIHPFAPHVATTLILGLLLGTWSAASHAAPSIWEEATKAPEDEARALLFNQAMQNGYEFGRHALAAEAARGGDEIPVGNRRTLSDSAAAAFRAASRIDPAAPDPYYYLALLLIYTKLECRDICDFEPAAATEVIEALDAFEARAPLDPRMGLMMFNRRAIYHTRLAGETKGEVARGHLEAALAAYRTAVERFSSTRTDPELVYGNMAETLMMLGNVEEAIEQYRHAMRVRPSTGITLGLAVALDRDERGTEARSLLRELGTAAIVEWEGDVSEGNVFYVPDGEIEYYRGLINESFGNYEAAAGNYSTFIEKRAHPQFLARAAANRAALRAKLP